MSTHLLVHPSPRLQSLAARAAVRAEAMGLLPEGAGSASSGPEGAAAVLESILHTARNAGIGRALTVPADTTDESRWQEFGDGLIDALEESPVPGTEWVGLERVLGAELLANLVGVSGSSLHRYATGARLTPDDVAARLHHIALVVGDLTGSYNDIGARRWFSRPRTQLRGQAPEALLQGAWDPHDEGPAQVRQLAASLLGAGAT